MSLPGKAAMFPAAYAGSVVVNPLQADVVALNTTVICLTSRGSLARTQVS